MLSSTDQQNLLGSFENIIGEIDSVGNKKVALPIQAANLSMLKLPDPSKESISAEVEKGKISFMSEKQTLIHLKHEGQLLENLQKQIEDGMLKEKAKSAEKEEKPKQDTPTWVSDEEKE